MNRILSIFGKDKKNRDECSDISMMLHSLGPKIITDEKELKTVEPYLKLLAGCVEDKRITNIAVTGTYGSGKSTVLKTFQNRYKPFKDKEKEKYLNISLASFDAEKENVQNSNQAKDFERRVELSILQQMFYQVKSSELPGSRFKRIKNITSGWQFLYILFSVLWMLSASVVLSLGFIDRTPLKWFIANTKSWWNIVPWVIVLLGIGLIIRKAIFTFSNSRINKINIKGEMELGDMGESIFNQYLEEILYFFERTKYEVVFLEDIDRFGDTQLFTKLREVNILLNSSKSINRRIKFIYAVKDDMFKDRTERTKFFDFIIPIIPFVNPSNASDQLKRLLDGNEIKLSDNFLEDITSFIGDIDMRLIINIFNEFNLYKKKTATASLEKLISIVFYKNLYPEDFSLLHQNEGKLFKLLTKRKEYQDALIGVSQERIKKIDDEIKKIIDEKISSIQELRKIYLFELLVKLPDLYQFDMGFQDINDAIIDENFKQIISSKGVKYITRQYDSYYREWNIQTKNIKESLFKDVEKEISDTPYLEREKHIQKRANGELERLRKEKQEVIDEQLQIGLLKFSELYGKIGQEEDFKDFEKEGKLIRYLILRGHINEDYIDYISLFFDVSITREDYEYIQNVKLVKPAQFDFVPSSPQKVLAEISEHHLKDSSGLNYDLVSYCLNNKETESAKLKLYIDLVSSSDPLSLDFIMGFVKNKPDDVPLLIAEISGAKTNLWHQLLEIDLPEDELEKWVIRIFDFSQKSENIINLDTTESLEEYIRKCKVFDFAKALSSIENLKEFMSKKGIKIEVLDLPGNEQMEFFKFIYEEYHFKLNVKNIIQIVKVLEPDFDTNSLRTSNNSMLKQLDVKTLLNIVEEDFENYLNQVLLSEKNKEETEETIIDVLNRSDVDTEIKEKFVLHQTAVIESLSKIEGFEVKKVVVSSGKLTPTWDNVLDYFDSLDENEFDDILVQYLNNEQIYDELSRLDISETECNTEFLETFAVKLINNNDLNNNAYSKLLPRLQLAYGFINLTALDLEKVEILIKQKALALTKENYDEIATYFSDLVVLFITENQFEDGFVNKIDEFSIDDNLIIKLLESNNLDQSFKIELVYNIEENKILQNSVLAKSLFNWWSNDIEISYSFEVLEFMFNSVTNFDKKIVMLLHFVERLGEEQIKSLTTLIGGEFEKLFTPYQKPKFEKTPKVEEFLKLLEEKNLLSSIKIKKKTIYAYPYNKSKDW